MKAVDLHRALAGLQALQDRRFVALALLGMKKHLNRICAGTLIEGELARDIAEADASADLREGALAWQQKRDPVFQGR